MGYFPVGRLILLIVLAFKVVLLFLIYTVAKTAPNSRISLVVTLILALVFFLVKCGC